MRLLFSISYYSPYLSGLTLYVKRVAEALNLKGAECSVITNRHSRELKQTEALNGVKVIRAKPDFRISKGFISGEFILQSYKMVRKNDVVIVNLPQFEGIFPSIFAKISGKKLIAVYHCEVILPPGPLNLAVQWCLTIANMFTLAFADTVITYTEDFADNSRVLQLFKSKLKTIYPPIVRPVINKRVQKVFLEKTGGTPGILIGIAARLSAEKGFEYLIEALPLLQTRLQTYRGGRSNIKIAVAGSLNPVGEAEYKEKIMKLVNRFKKQIVFLGEIKEEDMGSFYSILDVLVLPSVNSTEAFGMVQVEAMMSGIPVVATNLPGVRIPIRKTGMGKIVPMKNPEAIASALTDIIVNKSKYIKSYDAINNEFNIAKTIKFYGDLAGYKM